MANIEIVGYIKYLWAGFIPIAMRWHSMLNDKFIKHEQQLDEHQDRLADLNADVKVLVERTENLQKTIDEIKDLLMKEIINRGER